MRIHITATGGFLAMMGVAHAQTGAGSIDTTVSETLAALEGEAGEALRAEVAAASDPAAARLALSGVTHANAVQAMTRAGGVFMRGFTGAFGAPAHPGGVDRVQADGVRVASLGGAVALPSDSLRQDDGYAIWAAPFRFSEDTDSDETAPGHETDMRGVTAGYERAFSDGRAVGVAIGYGDFESETDGGLGVVEADMWAIGAFARYARGAWRARVAGAYTYIMMESERRIAFAGLDDVVRADDVNGHQAGGYARVAYRAGPGREDGAGLVAEPYFQASFGQFDRQSFVETGSEFTILEVDDEDALSALLGVGVSASWGIQCGQVRVAPHMGLGLDVEVLDLRAQTGARLGSGADAFVIETAAPSRIAMTTGAGIELAVGPVAGAIVYEGGFSGDRETHLMSARVGVKF